MEPCSFRVQEMRRDDLDASAAAADRVGSNQLPPLPRFEAAAQKAKPDPVAERRAFRHRRDPAKSVTAVIAFLAQDRSTFECLAPRHRNQADKLRTVLALQVGALAQYAADEGLAHRCHAAEAEIVQRGAAVELRPADVSFLHPQGAKRFE